MSLSRHLRVVLLAILVAPVHAQPGDRDGKDRSERNTGRDRDKIKPYDELITEDAQSDAGVFSFHRV